MWRLLQAGVAASVRGALEAAAAAGPQRRLLNVHEYQGAQLMAKFGINVPDGAPATTVNEAVQAAMRLKDAAGEVRRRARLLASARTLSSSAGIALGAGPLKRLRRSY